MDCFDQCVCVMIAVIMFNLKYSFCSFAFTQAARCISEKKRSSSYFSGRITFIDNLEFSFLYNAEAECVIMNAFISTL